MIEAVIVAIIGACGSLAGVYFSNRKAQAVQEFRLQQLEKEVDLHNNAVERLYNLEQKVAVMNNEVENIERDIK